MTPRSASRRAVLSVATALATFLGLIAFAVPMTAQAANNYLVHGNVPRPEACNNHGTITPGSWITNGPCGYVMGTALAGQSFDVNDTSDKGFHFGRVRQGAANYCAWVLPSALDLSTQTSTADSCGSSTRTNLQNSRLAFGRDFDAAPHTGNGAIIVDVDPSACTGYYNYFSDSSFDSGSFRDPVNFPLSATGSGYRYSSKDRQAAMIRTPYNGETYWIFVPRSCIESQLAGHTLNNQDNPEAG